jgi:hypothetical protein
MLFHLLPFGGELSEDVISLVIFLVVSEVKMLFHLLPFGGE